MGEERPSSSYLNTPEEVIQFNPFFILIVVKLFPYLLFVSFIARINYIYHYKRMNPYS